MPQIIRYIAQYIVSNLLEILSAPAGLFLLLIATLEVEVNCQMERVSVHSVLKEISRRGHGVWGSSLPYCQICVVGTPISYESIMVMT